MVPMPFWIGPRPARAPANRASGARRTSIWNVAPYRVAKLPVAAVLRAMTISETRGFMKVLIEAESDRILGFTMFGAGAGDVMAAVQMAMLGGVPYTAIRDAVIAHPTMPEGLILLFGNVPPSPRTLPSVRGSSECSSPEIRLDTAALEQVGIRRRAGPRSSISYEVIIVDGSVIKEKSWIAGRILDRFKAHFGQDNVFMDVDGNNQIVQGGRSWRGKLSASNRLTAISRNGVCRSRPALAPATW
jgi:hypothetical protein